MEGRLTQHAAALALLVSAGCAPAPSQLVALPEVDLHAAFVVRLADGRVAEHSPLFSVENGQASFGAAATRLELGPSDEALLIGVAREQLLAFDGWIDVSDATRVQLREGRESCSEGSVDAAESRMAVPVDRVGGAWTYDRDAKSFLPSQLAGLTSALEFTLSVPLRATGCASPDDEVLRPFFAGGDTTLRWPPGTGTGAIDRARRVDDDRVLALSAGYLGLFDRTSSSPLLPVSVWAAPPSRSALALDVRPSGGDVTAVVIAHRASDRVNDVIELTVTRDSIDLVGTATSLPGGKPRDMTLEPSGGVVFVEEDGVLWSAATLAGSWQASTQVLGTGVDIVHGTDDPTRRHALGARQSGALFLGDAHADRFVETDRVMTTLEAVTSHFDGAGLYLWGSTNGAASFEPPRFLSRSPSGSWQKHEIRLPPRAGNCVEREERACGHAPMFGAFKHMRAVGAAGQPEHRVYALPDECFSLVSYRARNLCLTYVPVEGMESAPRGSTFRHMDANDTRVTVFGGRGRVYELRVGGP